MVSSSEAPLPDDDDHLDDMVDDNGCWNCGGSGWIEHQCFEDTCCCLDPDDDPCPECNRDGRNA